MKRDKLTQQLLIIVTLCICIYGCSKRNNDNTVSESSAKSSQKTEVDQENAFTGLNKTEPNTGPANVFQNASESRFVNELNKLGTQPGKSNALPYYQKATELFVSRPASIRALDTNISIQSLTQKQKATLKQWVDQNKKAIEHLKLGSQQFYYWPNYSGNLIMEVKDENLETFRELTFALRWQTEFHLEQSKFKEALRIIISLHHLGDHTSKGPRDILDQLVGIAIHRQVYKLCFQFAQTALGDLKQLSDLQEHLQKYSTATNVDYTFNKAMMYESTYGIFGNKKQDAWFAHDREITSLVYIEMSKSNFTASSETLQKKYQCLERHTALQVIDRLYTTADQLHKKSPARIAQESINIPRTLDKICSDYAMAYYLCPNIARIHEVYYRATANKRALMTTLAILRYHAEHKSYPPDLNSLVSTHHLTSLPIDPFSDHPFVYRLVDDSFILYSLGSDLDDDGGRHDSKWGGDDGDFVFWPIPETR